MYFIEILGEKHREDTQVDCLIRVLETFEKRQPGFIQEFSKLDDNKRQDRRIVVRNRGDLRKNRDGRGDMIDQSKSFGNGWFITKIMSGEQVLSSIRLACSLANAKWGKDVVLFANEWSDAWQRFLKMKSTKGADLLDEF